MEERSPNYDQEQYDRRQEELKAERQERRQRLGQYEPEDERTEPTQEERTEA